MKRNVILLHIAFWFVFFAFKFLDYSSNLGYARAAMYVTVPNFFNVAASYFHYFLLIPLLLKKRWLEYTIITIGMLALTVWSRGYAESLHLSDIFNTDYYDKWTMGRIMSTIWSTGSFILFIAMLRFTIDRFVLESQKKALENEKLNAELNYLKAQINPHFLFNTLHNLNYLTQIKSDQATEVIMKLSNIMRYMIYESNKPRVALGLEINYIKDYLDLESIRLNNEYTLEFDVSQADPEIRISPLLLIPLVENAFKHGISDRQSENRISISLKCDEENLHLRVTNSLKDEKLEKEEPSGFGLENLRQRLTLSYPDRYELKTSKESKEFIAELSLRLG